jgi:hypothetical protein
MAGIASFNTPLIHLPVGMEGLSPLDYEVKFDFAVRKAKCTWDQH